MADQNPDLAEFHEISDSQELRRINNDLTRQLRAAKAKTEDLVAATFSAVRDAVIAHGPMPPIKTPKAEKRVHGEEVALWHLTDWQGAKVTESYNSDVLRERIFRFVEKAHRLTQLQRQDHPVKRAVILLGGDIGEGLFQYPAQISEVDTTLFGQFAMLGRLEAEIVREALSIYEQVQVVSEWGNHGRIGGKRAEVPRADNFDRMIHELARVWLSDPEEFGLHKRLDWEDSAADIQHVEIGKYRALLVHGDEVGRNGYVSKGQFIQAMNRWKAGAHEWAFQDVYVGHYHSHGEDALADGIGAVYWTGAPESDNRYAKDRLAVTSGPSQRLHFVDPEAGRVTAQHKIWLDN